MNKHYIISLLCLIFMISCNKENINKDRQPVIVESILENSNTQTVILKQQTNISSELELPIENAQVYIHKLVDGNPVKEWHLDGKGNGKWECNFRPLPDETYKLTVLIPGEKELVAVTTYPDTLCRFRFDSQSKTNGFPESYTKYTNNKYREDNPSAVWIYGMDYVPHSDSWSQANTMYWESGGGIISGDVTWEDIYNKWYVFPGKLSKYLRHEFYPVKELDAIPLVAGGGIGENLYFTDMKVHMNIHIIIDDYQYKALDSYFAYFNGTRYYSSKAEYSKYYSLHPKSYYMFQVVNNDLDQYLKDMCAVELGIGKEIDIYGNVENGYGIFGATYKTKITIEESVSVSSKPIWELCEIEFP